METLLQIQNISKVFGNFQAVNNVSFKLKKGETFGLVGESGSGKTTIANMIIGIHAPADGKIKFQNQSLWERGKYNRKEHGKMQIVFQDPQSSLDPRMTVRKIITEPLFILPSSIKKYKSKEENLVNLMKRVGLQEEHLDRNPHEFSGGQRQRIAIARALITDPEFILLDEPTSALDVSVQAQVLNLLKDLQQEKGLTYLFISHNMSVIRYMCNRVGVLYKGNIVEIGTTKDIFESPKHPYTKKLLSSIPGMQKN
ncbi:ATP-binding cassette domain-containing protein [Desulfoscipio geothermicus]|uniref:Peptide/nickel transport system ATP-binding protein n=1 Tax=Desulfoscipio geothermicus DSM 3669 TaxID=1121426 RepID=A0A1I6DT19_9FIRM|nr:ATP-binding cassette domain-containing protein [Desulfoscipio geothermicus]SFR08595.1 peptide/nickel transport system ATP-binding protein [Desulfoscipio geothermicus DSM 3669]